MSKTIDYDTSSMNGDDAMIDATDQFVTDMNKLYELADQIGLSKDFTDDLIDQMSTEASGSDAWTMEAYFTAFGVLVSDSNTVMGAVVFMMQVTSVIADCKNMTTIGTNAYSNVMSESTTDTNSSYFKTTTSDGHTQAYDDTKTFNDSVNVFLTTTFTVYNDDGTVAGTSQGILGLMTDADLCPADRQLMDTQSADLVETSLEGITGLFGSDWGNIDKETADIEKWSVPTVNDDGTESIDFQQNNTVINDFSSVNSQWDAQATTDQTITQQLATLMSQYQDAADETQEAMTSISSYTIQNTGS